MNISELAQIRTGLPAGRPRQRKMDDEGTWAVMKPLGAPQEIFRHCCGLDKFSEKISRRYVGDDSSLRCELPAIIRADADCTRPTNDYLRDLRSGQHGTAGALNQLSQSFADLARTAFGDPHAVHVG